MIHTFAALLLFGGHADELALVSKFMAVDSTKLKDDETKTLVRVYKKALTVHEWIAEKKTQVEEQWTSKQTKE